MMSVNRLRQRSDAGLATALSTVIYDWNQSQSWTASRNDLGKTQSIYDEASIQNFKTKKGIELQKYVTSRDRSPANFKPVRLATIIKGNKVYDGYLDLQYAVPQWSMKSVVHKGPILALASLDQGSIPFSVSATSYPNIDMATACWCLQQAANEASEPVHEFGVTLGELAETVSMLTSPLKAISTLSKKLYLNHGFFWTHGSGLKRSLMFRPHKSVPKKMRLNYGLEWKQSGSYVVNQASDFWLTWRFGIKPLLKEINDIMTMDYSNFESSPLRIARKRSAKNWTQGTGPLTAGSLGNGFYFIFQDTYRYRNVTQASYAYAVKHGTGFYDFLEANGLALRHIPQVMWELVPCSFVLDRFLDIGSFIRSITPDPNVTTLGTCVSTKFEAMITREFKYMYRDGFWAYSYPNYDKVNHKFRVWNNRYTRDVGEPVPIKPLFNPKLLKLEQQIDHATLLWQRLPSWR